MVEMNTGEGKTLAAIFPIILHVISGSKIHLFTFNDYLARRDVDWMRPVYEFCGLTIGLIQEGMDHEQRKEAYQKEVVYATAKQVGFDFLRNQIAMETDELLPLMFDGVIVDEADALMIDEARNPLVLAGDLETKAVDLLVVSRFIKHLNPELDFEMDPYGRNIFLTENGIEKLERRISNHPSFSTNNNLFSRENHLLLASINLALHAEHLLVKDVDYILQEGAIRLIDEFTGRIVQDRKWRHGLQMAVEAKEGLPVNPEGSILGTIPIQYFINLYKHKAGMTGTAKAAEEEFLTTYGLKTVVIPPHKMNIRQDLPDLIFTHKEAKLVALIKEIEKVHSSGRPILVGTISVKESEEIAERLKKSGIIPQVLNAKNDEMEASVIARAGQLGSVTISTNMAGRGTDIRLGEGEIG